MSDFDIKKSIIGRSLYGVDVMDWAVHVAELRLWLQLIVETELRPEQLRIQPLLPNLSFKIRQGDSLVEEIGGVNLAIRTGLSDISSSLKRKLTNLRDEKLKFYNNDKSCKFKSESMLLQEELNTFRDIIDERILNLSNRKKSCLKVIEPTQKPLFQKNPVGANNYSPLQNKKETIKKEIEKLNEELENVRQARLSLKGIHDKPFIWDIDFAEIFSGETHGFDIVIGNPPYVRQEKIDPPLVSKDKVTNEMKKDYKDKLENSIRAHFDKRLPQRLDKKSDLYIYFYFHGLALLNPKGTFCFITSNSWLDVGYGKNLQEFLLENVHIKAIYDNSAKRSFSQADINTVIVILSAPLKKRIVGVQNLEPSQENSAKFVLFKKSFEDVITAENLIEIENVGAQDFEPLQNDSYRVISIPQRKLLEEGWEHPEDDVGAIHELPFKGKYNSGRHYRCDRGIGMWYLYLDESGDLGFDFVNKKPSKFFTITILVINGSLENRLLFNAVKKTLRRKLNPRGRRKRMVLELKGTKTCFEVKKYFYEQVKKLNFHIYSITLNKKRVYALSKTCAWKRRP